MLELILFCLSCSHPKIEAPKPKPEIHRVADKHFWLFMGALAASKTADGFSSHGPQERGCVERNPFLERYPSGGEYAAFFAASYALEFGSAYLLKRYGQRHRWARHLWMIEPGRQTTLHAYWTARNLRMSCR